MSSRSPGRLLAVLAHPDDESLGVGGTLARYASEDVDVCLVTATRGDGGRFRGHWPEHHRTLWGRQSFYRALSAASGGRAREMDLFEGVGP